jgi:hypothetical protein
VRTVRDLGLGGVQRMPGLKRFFMRRAMGQSADQGGAATGAGHT